MAKSPESGVKRPKKPGDVMDKKEAAEFLRLSERQVERLLKDTNIPHARIGRRVIFHRKPLSEWIANGGPKPKGDPLDDLTTEKFKALTPEEQHAILNDPKVKIRG